jgi:hypothetical protein
MKLYKLLNLLLVIGLSVSFNLLLYFSFGWPDSTIEAFVSALLFSLAYGYVTNFKGIFKDENVK